MEKSECKRIIRWLPPHIIQVIFSKLPFPSLPTCRVVCKIWNDLVLNHTSTCKFTPDSLFLCTHWSREKIYCIDFEFDHKDLDLGGISIVASIPYEEGYWKYCIVNSPCNGLVLVFRFAPFCPCILNPLTNDCINLPVDHFEFNKDGKRYRYGFGFSPNTKRYKIARVRFDGYKSKEESNTMLHILTFGESGGTKQWKWRFVCSMPPLCIEDQGTYFDGAVYWICEDKKNGLLVICRVDLEKEKIDINTCLPTHVFYSRASLQSFNGSLYATFTFIHPPKIEVWRRMQMNGSWIKQFVIDNYPNLPVKIKYMMLVKAYENGDILIQINFQRFALFDTKIGRMKTVHLFEVTCQIICLDSLNFDSLQNILFQNAA